MAAGQVPIESVRSGDWVWSEDETTHSLALKPVLGVERTHPDALLRLTTRDSDRETLLTTPTHPFFVANRHAFVPAEQLKPGDRLQQKDGAFSTVEGITRTNADGGKTTTYNLEIEGFHTPGSQWRRVEFRQTISRANRRDYPFSRIVGR